MEPSLDRQEAASWRIVCTALAVPALAVLIAFGLAIVATILTASFFFDGGGGDSDTGNGLGVLIVFVGAWALCFVLTSPAVAYWFARRPTFASRHRVAVTLLLGIWVPVSVAVGGGAAWFGYRSGLEFIGGLLGVFIAVALVAAVVSLNDRLRMRNIWVATAGVAAVFAIGVVLMEPIHRAAIYSEDPPPMGLIDGAELAASLPGWRLVGYEDAPRDAGWPYARVTVVTPTGVELEVTFEPRSDGCRPNFGSCDALSALDDGSAVTVWGDTVMCGTPRRPAYVSVDAQRDDGTWSVDSKNRCHEPEQPTLDELRTLLNLVRPVTLDEWIDAT